jgi:ribosome biogenesis protein ERB1
MDSGSEEPYPSDSESSSLIDEGSEYSESEDEDRNGLEGSGDDDDDDYDHDSELKKIRQQLKKEVPDDIQTLDIQTVETDSSDEETLNPVGNIPMEWYNDYPHIGYDLSGKKIMKPATSDELDRFLAKMDDPNWGRTAHDKTTARDIVLTDEELDMVQRIQAGRFPSGYDPHAPYVD